MPVVPSSTNDRVAVDSDRIDVDSGAELLDDAGCVGDADGKVLVGVVASGVVHSDDLHVVVDQGPAGVAGPDAGVVLEDGIDRGPLRFTRESRSSR